MTGKLAFAFGVLLMGLAHSAPGLAQDAAAGRDKARACVACHGKLGIAEVPNAPHLAGENRRYLASQLRAFRSGKRKHSQMTLIAKSLSDDDIADLSAWFAAIEITATAPKLE